MKLIWVAIYFCLKDEETVAKITPDFSALKALDLGVGVIVTASGDSVDFVSRTFPETKN